MIKLPFGFSLERRSGSLRDLERLLLSANSTAAGIAVSPESALTYPPVLAAVRLISESVAMLPAHLFRKNGDDRQRADDHPVEGLISRRPAAWLTPFQLKADMTAALLLHGEAFALIARSADGRPLELIPLPNSSVTVTTGPALEPEYRLTLADGTQRVLAREEVFHLRGLTIGANKPLSPVHEGRQAIGLGLALERHAANLMSRGARPAGSLEVPGKLSPARSSASAKASKTTMPAASPARRWSSRKARSTRRSPSARLTFSFRRCGPSKSLILRDFSAFRCPLLSEMSRVTHANAESLGQQFLSLTLLPYLRLWAETIQRDLLTEDEADLYAEFQTGALEMADLSSRIDAYVKAVAGGVMVPNEARAKENLAPVAGGDVLRVPLNTGAADGAAANG